jgi:hypothetical protein
MEVYFHKILLDADHVHHESHYQLAICDVLVLHLLEVMSNGFVMQSNMNTVFIGTPTLRLGCRLRPVVVMEMRTMEAQCKA